MNEPKVLGVELCPGSGWPTVGPIGSTRCAVCGKVLDQSVNARNHWPEESSQPGLTDTLNRG